MKQEKTTGEASNIDMTIESTDTIGTQRTLNNIRFDDWERSDWLDNELSVHYENTWMITMQGKSAIQT